MRSSIGYMTPSLPGSMSMPGLAVVVPAGPSIWKLSLAVLPMTARIRLGSWTPGNCTENAVGADALDGRLGHADLVDAPADDFKALLDRRLGAFGHARLGRRDGDYRVRSRDNVDIRRADSERTDGGGELAQQRQRLLALACLSQRDRDHIGVAPDRLRLDACLAKNPDGIGVEGLHTLALQCRGIDLEHKIGSAP